MKRKLNEANTGLIVEHSVSKRSKDSGVFAQYCFKHRLALSKFAKLRAFVHEGLIDGLIPEIRRALRQQTSKVRKKGEKNSFRDGVSRIFGSSGSVGEPLTDEMIKTFYESLLDDESRPLKVSEAQDLCGEIELFGESEIKTTLKHRPKGKACGVDRVSKSMLFSISKFPARFEYVFALLDAFLMRGVPTSLKVALVTLVPKKERANHPREYRPISVTSLLYRLYSRLLSLRFYNAINTQLSDAQGGYRMRVNGCSKNLAILRSLIGEAKVKAKDFAVASVDLSKAFDSVSHTAVRTTLKEMCIPEYLRRACLDTLDDNILKFNSKVKVLGKRGVPQGLPLSGYLFIATIDRVVKKLDELLPYTTDSGREFGALCLVDDLLLFSESEAQLGEKLRVLKDLLKSGGWRLNSAKSYAYAHRAKGKCLKVSEGCIPIGEGESIRLIPAREKFRYLGIAISGANALRDNSAPIIATLKEVLKKITYGNLSVVNKLRLIKEVVIPKQVYRLANISTKSIWHEQYKAKASTSEKTRSNLTRLYNHLDREIMRSVKTILRVPQCGVDTSYFYVNEASGGLGLHRLEVLVPSMRIRLRNEMVVDKDTMKLLDSYHFNDIADCHKLLAKYSLNSETLSREARNKAMIANARKTTSGLGRYFPSTGEVALPLIRKGNSSLGFSSYRLQRAVRFRLNCLPTRSRLNKIDSTTPKSCRLGCSEVETIPHLLNHEKCGDIKSLWVSRHNSVSKHLFKSLSSRKKRGVNIVSELATGSYQPDLVVYDNERAFVLEVAVTWAKGESLKRMFKTKKSKYSSSEMTNELNAKLNAIHSNDSVRKVTVIPLVFSVQGSYLSPGNDWESLVGRMMAVKSLRKCLLVGAQIALEQSLKYLGKILCDRKLYTNTRVT